jgi:hypothetical protein
MSDKVRPLFKGHSDGRNPLYSQINLLAMKVPKTASIVIDTPTAISNKVKIDR